MAAIPIDNRRSMHKANEIQSRSVSPTKAFRRSMTLPPNPHHPGAALSATNGTARDPSPGDDPQSLGEPDILTALAAQERLVLELKESLQKAEEDLVKLKKQWATHESLKRRNERYRMQQMKPLSTLPSKTLDSDDDPDGSSAWMYEEMERRKALLGNTRSSHRRVFSGSREAKTLSLLSPIKTTESRPSTIESQSPAERRSRDPVKKSVSPQRSATVQDSPIGHKQFPLPIDEARNNSRSPQREAIIQTGKQLATDLREGLWTFFEDLRQAAVGDEVRTAVSITPAKSSRHGSPALSHRRTSPDRRPGVQRSRALEYDPNGKTQDEDAGSTFWKGQGLPEPTIVAIPATPKRSSKRRSTHQESPSTRSSPAVDSGFETSPPASSTATTKRSFNNNPNVQGQMTSISPSARPLFPEDEMENKIQPVKQRDAIPWPELTKLTPSNFKRTASELMAELERSLTPSPRTDVDEDTTGFYDGLMH